MSIVPAPRSHHQREQEILTDIEAHFPAFAGQSIAWRPIAQGNDPPDFIGQTAHGLVGLEFVEWLDGSQMTPAKGREFYRKHIRTVLESGWLAQYLPQNIARAFLSVRWDQRLAVADQDLLRQQFFKCAQEVDRAWQTNPDRRGRIFNQHDLSAYPVLNKYFYAVRYIDGTHHGNFWVDMQEDGGFFDPMDTVRTLESVLDAKMAGYAVPDKQSHLGAHQLAELWLLVHGGYNIYAYNRPRGPLTLRDIAAFGTEYCAQHSQKRIFDKIWLFHAIDSADDINARLGIPAGTGRIRWLAQIWPMLNVDPRSIPRSSLIHTT